MSSEKQEHSVIQSLQSNKRYITSEGHTATQNVAVHTVPNTTVRGNDINVHIMETVRPTRT